MDAVLGFVLHSLASIACVMAAMSDDIEAAVGSGCENRMQFTTSFYTTGGEQCADCEFCSGSMEAHIFDHKMEDVCMECTSADADCDVLEIVTSFDEAWTPTFFHLVSAAMDSTEDPSQITLLGSNDKTEWISLFAVDDDTSSPLFPTRKTRETFSVFNSMAYKHFSLRLKRKEASTNMNIGAYGIVQDYIKKCSAKIFDDIIGFKPTDIVPIRGKKLTTMSNPPNQFFLSFKLYPRDVVSGWSNILLFTNTNNNCCNWPDRWLVMHFRPGSYTLTIVAGTTVYPNNQFDAYGVKPHTWNDIRVEAVGDLIKLYIDGVRKVSLINTNRPLLGKVDVYVSSVHYDPANVIIRDFEFLPLKPTDIVPIKGKKLTTIYNPPNQFFLSFKLYPRDVVSEWSNILLFNPTTNIGCCNWSDRWLVMYFRPGSYTLTIVAGTTVYPNNQFDAYGVKPHTWNDIRVEAVGDLIKLYIDGVRKVSLINTNRPLLGKVDVYVSGLPHDPANVIIRDFEFLPM